MSHISAIVCTSSIDGFIFVNGFSQGPCNKGSALSVPWNGNTPLFISFTPQGGNYLTTSLAFTTLSSLPICENVDLTLWTGVVEVNFRPKKSVLYPPPLLPYELTKESFSLDDTSHTVSLIDYCGIWLIVENTSETKLCEYLSEDSSDYMLDVRSGSPTLLHIRVGDMHWIVSSDDGDLAMQSIGTSTCTIDNGKLTFASASLLAPLCTDVSIDGSDIRINKYITSHNNGDDKQIAVDFLASIITQDYDHAYSLLSATLQRSFTQQQIVDYIGKIHSIVENKYYNQNNDTTLAVLTMQSQNVNIASAYSFEIDSMKKINNIAPL